MLEVAIVSTKCALRDEFPEFMEFYQNKGWEPKKEETEEVVEAEVVEAEAEVVEAEAEVEVADTEAKVVETEVVETEVEATEQSAEA